MGKNSFLSALSNNKKAVKAIVVLGAAGMILIMLSSFSGSKKEDIKDTESINTQESEKFRCETEERLEDFLRTVDGVGEVKVYLAVSGENEYVYATEGKKSIGENKSEEEKKYVIIGSNGNKSALVETVNSPKITGAVIACTGADSPTVQEAVYKAASAALDIPTAKIYVTLMR